MHCTYDERATHVIALRTSHRQSLPRSPPPPPHIIITIYALHHHHHHAPLPCTTAGFTWKLQSITTNIIMHRSFTIITTKTVLNH
jgi:hypothetical protein